MEQVRLNKREVAMKIAEKTGDSIASAERAIDAFAEVCKETMAENGIVAIGNFMKIEKRTVKARTIRTPLGTEMDVPERNLVRVTVAKSWRK